MPDAGRCAPDCIEMLKGEGPDTMLSLDEQIRPLRVQADRPDGNQRVSFALLVCWRRRAVSRTPWCSLQSVVSSSLCPSPLSPPSSQGSSPQSNGSMEFGALLEKLPHVAPVSKVPGGAPDSDRSSTSGTTPRTYCDSPDLSKVRPMQRGIRRLFIPQWFPFLDLWTYPSLPPFPSSSLFAAAC